MHQVGDLVALKVNTKLEYEIMHSILDIPITVVDAPPVHAPTEKALDIHLTIPHLVIS